MFQWYKNSSVCYVYLADISRKNMELASSRWFTRGWTLQELIAPREVVFFDEDWREIGHRREHALLISRITGIDPNLLGEERSLSSREPIQDTSSRFCIAKRMSWVSKRKTTRVEDQAYCLLGLFNANMPLLYGEGKRAFIRLQEEIMKTSNDDSILA